MHAQAMHGQAPLYFNNYQSNGQTMGSHSSAGSWDTAYSQEEGAMSRVDFLPKGAQPERGSPMGHFTASERSHSSHSSGMGMPNMGSLSLSGDDGGHAFGYHQVRTPAHGALGPQSHAPFYSPCSKVVTFGLLRDLAATCDSTCTPAWR